jgi:hypothetical protein
MTTRYYSYAKGASPADALRSTRIHAAAVLALAILLSLLASATPLNAQRMRAADLRCLTSKQDDCLPEPMSIDEPHQAICATCHNVWTQRTPAEAARTCAGSDCHARADTLTPFHRGLAVQVRRNCIGCHPAHDVRIPEGGNNCTFCHTSGGAATAAKSPARQPSRIVMVGRTPAEDRVFRHEKHTEVACTSCHTNAERHGSVSMTRPRDCQSCHHTGERLASLNCASCHQVTRVRIPARPGTALSGRGAIPARAPASRR